ncbi:MAG: STAS domain-containing protein [Thermoleophilaceae bacterium]
MSPLADIAVERHGARVVARLAGEVDVTNVGSVGRELIGAVPNDAHGLVVDLAATDYLDSAAIELLFDLSRRLHRRRQDLRLVVPAGSPLTRVLELTEVDTAAPLHETLAGALADR